MSIELLIKLHAPKAVSIEAESQRAGRSPDGIGREDVLAALAHAERLHPVGVAVLRARHLSDCCASTSATTHMAAVKQSEPGSWSCWGTTITLLACGPSSSLAVNETPRVVAVRPAPAPGNSPSQSRTPARTVTPDIYLPRHWPPMQSAAQLRNCSIATVTRFGRFTSTWIRQRLLERAFFENNTALLIDGMGSNGQYSAHG
jgi:hypothetical protein